MRLKSIILGLAFPALVSAQTEIYKPYKNLGFWTSDTLYVGASFIYKGGAGGGGGKWGFKFGASQPIKVTLRGNEAGWSGQLWAIVQDGSGKDHRKYLFRNFDPPGTSVDLRDIMPFVIPAGAEIYFEYVVTEPVGVPCWGCWLVTNQDVMSKFSGPNRGFDRHRSGASSDLMPNPNWRFANRWSVVGRTPDDDLEFGFEDCTSDFSDMDFDDVVFTVSNLEIGIFNRRLVTRDLVR